MNNLCRCDVSKYQRQVTSTVKGASVQVCSLQRTRSLRGNSVAIGQRPVVCHAGQPQDPQRPDREEFELQEGTESMGHGLNPQPPSNARWEHDFHPEKLVVPINASSALSGMEIEAGDAQLARSPSPSSSPVQYSHYSTDPKGWYECHLFEVLQGAHIDAQAASHFFSHLAVHDSWASPLTMNELLHTVRIADITGFALPPVIVAQLQNLVQSSGPQASQSSADPLLAAYAYDFPALLDMLQGTEITPSAAWTDYALHAWFAAVGGRGGGQLSAAHIRSVMTILEAIYIPGAEPSVEPQSPLPSASSSQNRGPGAISALGSGASTTIVNSSLASVRGWLDACLTALLDSDALRHAHQREDLYGMLPHLATAPSAAIVERLYSEAWPPYNAPSGAASPEHIASMLWLLAASGAKLPPAVIQGELRALEEAVLRIAWNGSGDVGTQGSGSGVGGGPVSNSGGTADGADPTAAAAAALKAAFALPSSPGASGRASSPSPPSPSPLQFSAASDPLDSMNSLPLSSSPPPLQPQSLPSRPDGGRRISPFGAYLALWAFHHYHYIPHAASALFVGPTLLSAAVNSGGAGAGRGLGPRQRCRIVRAVLMCFGSVPPQLFAKYDWSSLFRGWELLGKRELLPLLQDAAALAHQRRKRRQHGSEGVQGDVGAQLLRLSHLVAHVVQLTGWQRRLEHVELSDAITSLAGLLAVLIDEVSDTAGREAASESGAPHDTKVAAEARNDIDGGGVAEGSFLYSSDGDGGGGGGAVSAKAILASPFAQGLLASWLGLVLPAIQDAIKHLTGDWGNAGRAAGGVGGDRAGGAAAAAAAAAAADRHKQHRDPYQQFQDPQSGRGLHDVGGGAVSGSMVRYSDPARPPRSVAISAAAADARRKHGTLAWRSPSGLPPPVTAETVLAQRRPPPLTAAELTWTLMVLRDAAAALDPRGHPALHRTLMWAMQRLGSRAGKCAVEPEAFAFVPRMLVQMDTLGWVDVPLEWAHAVVEYPDAEGPWFGRLPWHEVMHAVLGSAQLVQRARAEVLRCHGAEAPVAVMTAEASESQRSRQYQQPQQLPGDSPGPVLELDSDKGRNHVATMAAVSSGPENSRPSKAEALLAAAQRLRSHLIGLMSARLVACSVVELRQVALTWQVYGMAYDKEVLELMVSALAGALAAALVEGNRGNGASVTALTLGSVRDAAARLEMMCESQQVAQEEVEHLFRPLSVYGL
ncbi:hypothetical protein VaNZ11_008344 [Volvox africanus]|uniref:Uncharacterized protein n=1 Tax=Volvox africanus TaxID=51714 RepID=A0ABQ5S616_9CHLO|nr:hypothetical protein VaNZ11_008344 [Volvox africanus]